MRNEKEYPQILRISVTDRWNLDEFTSNAEEYRDFYGDQSTDISIEQLKRVENAIGYAQTIELTGFGEFFLHPQWEEILSYIYSINPRTNLIRITTNGTLLDRQKAYSLCGHLQSFHLVLNAASSSTYRRYMGGDLDSVLSKFWDFFEGLPHPDQDKVAFNFLVHRGNLQEMVDFVIKACNLLIFDVNFFPLVIGRERDILYSIFFAKQEYNLKLLEARKIGLQIGMNRAGRPGMKIGGCAFGERPANRFSPETCRYPFEEANIDLHGFLSSCCYSNRPLGNVYDKDFETIWFGESFIRLREKRDFPDCRHCRATHFFDEIQAHVIPSRELEQKFQSIHDVLIQLDRRTGEDLITQWRRVYGRTGLDAQLYWYACDFLGNEYEKKLEEWITSLSDECLQKVDCAFDRYFSLSDCIPELDSTLDFHGMFLGTGWGISESNIHGQKWRWIGSSGSASVFIQIPLQSAYTFSALIHTALNDSLTHLTVEIWNQFLPKQRIVTENNQFLLQFEIPESVVQECGGKVKITFRIIKKSITELPPGQQSSIVALTRLAWSPSLA